MLWPEHNVLVCYCFPVHCVIAAKRAKCPLFSVIFSSFSGRMRRPSITFNVKKWKHKRFKDVHGYNWWSVFFKGWHLLILFDIVFDESDYCNCVIRCQSLLSSDVEGTLQPYGQKSNLMTISGFKRSQTFMALNTYFQLSKSWACFFCWHCICVCVFLYFWTLVSNCQSLGDAYFALYLYVWTFLFNFEHAGYVFVFAFSSVCDN